MPAHYRPLLENLLTFSRQALPARDRPNKAVVIVEGWKEDHLAIFERVKFNERNDLKRFKKMI